MVNLPEDVVRPTAKKPISLSVHPILLSHLAANPGKYVRRVVENYFGLMRGTTSWWWD